MAEIKNIGLEQYELKKPDYDFIDREQNAIGEEPLQPLRYDKIGTAWKSKKTSRKLFRKKSVKLMFVGDITCFEKQFEEAKCGDSYDFRFEFENVKPIFEQADLVVGNLETMIFPQAPYRTEKYVSEQNFHCNAPVEFLDAIRYAGIDVLTNANNHDLDTGAVGIGETIDYVEKFGFIQTGTFKSDKKRYELIDVDGFKIAITAFATDHNNKRCNLTKDGVDFLLNDYSEEKARTIIEEARADGAELVFTCIHWGKENKTAHNNAQARIAKELANMGYDCIIGSHPHVLQPFEKIKAGDKTVPVFYSMGNFVSHNVNNQKSRSMIACIDLERKGKEINLECSYIPIYTSKNAGDKKYVLMPINNMAIDPRNIRKKDLIKKVVGEEIGLCKSVKFSECREKIDVSEVKAKKKTMDLKNVTNYPVLFDDGKFVYTIHEDHAVIEKISNESTTSSYTAPDTVLELPITSVAAEGFANHPILKKMNFKKNLTYISEGMCKGAALLEGFQLSNNIKEIRKGAFEGCISLSAAVMKNGVRKIDSMAFAGCTNLRSVKIPANVQEIAADAFEGCGKAVFYCEEGSYAEQFAKEHGFTVVNMDLS